MSTTNTNTTHDTTSVELTDEELENFRAIADGDGPAAQIAQAVLDTYREAKT